MSNEDKIDYIVDVLSREEIIEHIDGYTDGSIDWEGYSNRDILNEVLRSDIEAGEEEDGIFNNLYVENS